MKSLDRKTSRIVQCRIRIQSPKDDAGAGTFPAVSWPATTNGTIEDPCTCNAGCRPGKDAENMQRFSGNCDSGEGEEGSTDMSSPNSREAIPHQEKGRPADHYWRLVSRYGGNDDSAKKQHASGSGECWSKEPTSDEEVLSRRPKRLHKSFDAHIDLSATQLPLSTNSHQEDTQRETKKTVLRHSQSIKHQPTVSLGCLPELKTNRRMGDKKQTNWQLSTSRKFEESVKTPAKEEPICCAISKLPTLPLLRTDQWVSPVLRLSKIESCELDSSESESDLKFIKPFEKPKVKPRPRASISNSQDIYNYAEIIAEYKQQTAEALVNSKTLVRRMSQRMVVPGRLYKMVDQYQ